MSRAVLFLFFLAFALPNFVRANALCVTSERANLRAGPGTNQKITWTVGRYMPLKRVEARGGWIKVQDLDGETHWVVASSVSSKIQCVVVKKSFANLRRGPASSSPAADIPFADRYTPFKKVERDGAWLQIEDSYKLRSWVNDTNMWWPVTRTAIKF